MKKYLLFSFLMGFIPFSFFNPVKAMEKMEIDQEEAPSNPVSRQQQYVYVVSPEEGAELLSNNDLRKNHPMHDVIFGDLDAELYRSEKTSEELIYNSCCKKALEKLRQLAGDQLKVERDACSHLFLAAFSFLEGTNGVEQDREYGAGLMTSYIEKRKIPFREILRDSLRKLSEDQTYPVSSFIEEFQVSKRNFEKVDLSMAYSQLWGLQMAAAKENDEEFKKLIPYICAQEGGREILKNLPSTSYDK
jgi:hypothetical protein